MSDDQSCRFYLPFLSSPLLTASICCKLLSTFNSIRAFSAALSFCELSTLLNRGSYVWLQNSTVKARIGPLWFVIYAWFNSTCYHPPPGHTPGDLQFFSHLAVYSPPLGTQKETIPHPRDSSSTTNTLFMDHDIDFRTIAEPDVLTRT